MIAKSSNIKDVAKYFEGTYIIVPEVSEVHVMYLQEARTIGLVCKDSRNQKQGLISFTDGFEYNIQSPLATRKAWFLYNESPHLLVRIPARMWKKGICSENTVMYRLTADGLLSKVGMDAQALNAYLQYNSDGTLTKPEQHQVLSTQWAYNGKTRSFYLWDKLVAKWSSRSNELFVPKELADLAFPPVTQSMKVVYV